MIKRCFDGLFALLLIILISPVYVIVAIVIRTTLGRPVLFGQKRSGYKEKIFIIHKFRTMSNATDAAGHLLPDEQRLKGVGKLIRALSLDELPQLLNVLKGEMSFVGPRPLLIEYLPLYSEEQKRRHGVKPGITGWAQINGRNAISWEEKFKLDVWYVDNRSFGLDMKILWLTVLTVIKRKDINSATSATVEKFTGTL